MKWLKWLKWPRCTSIASMLVLLALVGCATPTAGSTSSAPAATSGSSRTACQGLAAMNTALTSLANAGDNITVGQLKTIQSGINVTLNAVGKHVPADSSGTLNQLKAANDQLAQTLASLPASDTLGQHASQLQQFKDQVAKAQSARSQLATKLNCSA